MADPAAASRTPPNPKLRIIPDRRRDSRPIPVTAGFPVVVASATAITRITRPKRGKASRPLQAVSVRPDRARQRRARSPGSLFERHLAKASLHTRAALPRIGFGDQSRHWDVGAVLPRLIPGDPPRLCRVRPWPRRSARPAKPFINCGIQRAKSGFAGRARPNCWYIRKSASSMRRYRVPIAARSQYGETLVWLG